mmetsp:Transcript_8095/g.23217  ORF Transcript_8095/g.23217 Transcript_8095/m.23217 type:complete len:595 (-) Transcript_8095:288-2072(-)
MLVQDAQFVQAYEAVKEELLRQADFDRKVPIFVSSVDCDSVCALRILAGVLQAEGIHYTVYPVSGWQEVQDKVRNEISDKEDLTNIFFINCGATEDLVELLSLDSDNQRVLVIDSHRPVHTGNADQNNGQVMVLMSENDEPPPSDLGDENDEDSDSDGDEDDSEEENEPPLQQRRTENDSVATKRAAKRRDRRRQEEERQRRRIEYYDRGAWRGFPASSVAYELCRQLHKEDNYSLWLSIVGLTDHFVHQLISAHNYQAILHGCRQQVLELGNAEMRDHVDWEEGGATRIPLNRRISMVKDYRFTLMKHWTLYEAMLYSNYVATRLQTWREKGRRNLELLLAKMGCSLAQCRQQYVHMKPSIKDQLSQKLENNAPAYNLPDLQFESFQLEQGYKRPISASDAVFSVTSLLESHNGDEGDSKGHFWRAYKAMRANSFTELMKGIDVAKKLQQTILEDGGSVIARRLVVSMSTFRLVNLVDGEVSDRNLLSQPLPLLKLAMFIQDAYRVMQNRVKPVVVVGPEGADHTCLIVGYTGRPKVTDLHGNRFGNAFAYAQDATKCDLQADYFDQYTVKVAKSDVLRFVATLDSGGHMKNS